MKKLYFVLIIFLLSISVFAQVPEKISYQAVIRDDNSQLIVNQEIGVRISILQGSAYNDAVYSEIQTPITNENGLISIEIGAGETTDEFTAINWAEDIFFIKTEIDPEGASSYTITVTNQLLSVPYALHAKTADSLTTEFVESDPEFTAWDKSSGISITENQISDLQSYILAEADPFYASWDKSYNDLVNTPNIIDSVNNVLDTTTQFLRTEVDGSVENEIQDLSEVLAENNSANSQIKDLVDPTDAQDAATKAYVDLLEDRIETLESFMSAVTDSDGDGFMSEAYGGTDCDDNDETIYPGAEEILDAKDNNCDGDIDEGLMTAGDIIVTEIMANPDAVSDASGEWFEITNVSSGTLNINGLVISDNGTDLHTVSGDLNLAPGESMVLGNNIDEMMNGGVSVDYQYSNFSLFNTGDEVILTFGETEIDRVVYEVDWAIQIGRSLSLNSGHYNSTDNDNSANWCSTPEEASYQIGTGDYGTPGVENPSCQ